MKGTNIIKARVTTSIYTQRGGSLPRIKTATPVVKANATDMA
jgi:hypothetical protein